MLPVMASVTCGKNSLVADLFPASLASESVQGSYPGFCRLVVQVVSLGPPIPDIAHLEVSLLYSPR